MLGAAHWDVPFLTHDFYTLGAAICWFALDAGRWTPILYDTTRYDDDLNA